MANPNPLRQEDALSVLADLRRLVSDINRRNAGIAAALQNPNNCPPDIRDNLLAKLRTLESAAVQGDAQRVAELLDAGEEQPNNAFMLAAFSGHQVIVRDLLNRGVDANFGVPYCLMGGHFHILLDLIKHGANVIAIAAYATMLFDELPHMLLGFMQLQRANESYHLLCVYVSAKEVGLFNTPNRAATFLAKIPDVSLRKRFATLGDQSRNPMEQTLLLVPLLPIIDMMVRYQLDYEEALAWQENRRLLPFLLLQEQGACGLPKDVWEIIACHIHPPTSSPLSLAQMHRVKNAIRQAFEPAWFNRLASQLRKRPHGQAKADHLQQATTIPMRIEALWEPRWDLATRKAFLTKSLRQTMIRYPKYCNGKTLQRWLENCADFLEHRVSRKQRRLGMQLRSLIQVITFPGESDDAKELAALLENDHGQPQSIRSLLEDHPYWSDLMRLFPELSACMSATVFEEPKKMLSWTC